MQVAGCAVCCLGLLQTISLKSRRAVYFLRFFFLGLLSEDDELLELELELLEPLESLSEELKQLECLLLLNSFHAAAVKYQVCQKKLYLKKYS